ncbi:hypothetical protein HMPREF1051_1025 [Neisseria sicca VK64]|uniref:Uncharacterized protein n=1 Tax=Neisseria sicca VK64 TaxID=1095748 RepID=I2NFG7_NEISI|nr:hypothetical protein HMPREF1051_1025 [Neisseria sicca VK64]
MMASRRPCFTDIADIRKNTSDGIGFTVSESVRGRLKT